VEFHRESGRRDQLRPSKPDEEPPCFEGIGRRLPVLKLEGHNARLRQYMRTCDSLPKPVVNSSGRQVVLGRTHNQRVMDLLKGTDAGMARIYVSTKCVRASGRAAVHSRQRWHIRERRKWGGSACSTMRICGSLSGLGPPDRIKRSSATCAGARRLTRCI